MIYNSTEEFLEIYSLQPKGIQETSLVYESLKHSKLEILITEIFLFSSKKAS